MMMNSNIISGLLSASWTNDVCVLGDSEWNYVLSSLSFSLFLQGNEWKKCMVFHALDPWNCTISTWNHKHIYGITSLS